jgi:peptidoglycan-N-acetylglucosamine deacetylase
MEQATHLGNELAITTSWDDGHPLDMRIAEMLSKHGIAGTFYVPLRNSRPTMRSEQIRQLSSSFEIGAHTVNHVRLTGLPPSQAEQEVTVSKQRLEDILGKSCTTFCFPGGRYDKTHFRMLRDAGFVAARTVELLSLRRPRTTQGIAVMPTTIQAYPHQAVSYFRNAAKRFSMEAMWNLSRGGRLENWPVFAALLLRRAADMGGVFHLWGHSWEIEETGQWQALERTLAALAECRERASFVTNGELCSTAGKAKNDDVRPALLCR